MTAALVPAICLVIAAAIAFVLSRQKPAYAPLTERFLVKAVLAESTPHSERRLAAQLRYFLLRRRVLAFFHPSWSLPLQVMRVRIAHPDTVAVPNHEYELDLIERLGRRPLGYADFQAKIASIAASALVALTLVGRLSPESATPTSSSLHLPEKEDESSVPPGRSFTAQPPGRWLLANLESPSPHPFRKPGSSAYSIPAVTIGHTDVAATPLLSGTPHANTPNLQQHSNNYTAHTNVMPTPHANSFQIPPGEATPTDWVDQTNAGGLSAEPFPGPI